MIRHCMAVRIRRRVHIIISGPRINKMPHGIGTSQTHPLSPDPDVRDVIGVWDWTAQQCPGCIPTVQSKEDLYISKNIYTFQNSH